jgi:hypothetical protein
MISWHSHEYHYHEKHEGWPVLVAIGTFVVALIALYQSNFLFFIFALIAGVLFAVWGMRPPRELAFALDRKGLSVGGRLHPYRHFSAFALDGSSLHLYPKSTLKPRLAIDVPDEREKEIRELLLEFLPEVEYTESLMEALGHLLRF